MNFRISIFVVAATLLVLCTAGAQAQVASTEPVLSLSRGSGQAWPAKTIRWIVPWPPVVKAAGIRVD
jgi:hypothetical protein